MEKKVIIRHISNGIKGGYTAVATGDGFVSPRVEMVSLADGRKTEAAVLQTADSHSVTFSVPAGKYQSYSVTVIAGDARSPEYRMNIPQIKWVQETGLEPGGELRVFGQGLIDLDLYPERQGTEIGGYGRLLDNPGAGILLRGQQDWVIYAAQASAYEIQGTLPGDIPPGAYTVQAFDGVGGVSEAYPVEIQEKSVYPADVFNVLDFGARPIEVTDVYYKNFYDSADAFQAALDAAEKNGGGTVFIPNGRYCFCHSLWIGKYTRLLGESSDRVWLELPKGMAGEDGWGTRWQGEQIQVFLAGRQGDFTVENVNILAVYSPVVIGAPAITGKPVLGDDKYNRIPCYANLIDADRDADRVVIKNCHIYHEPTFLDHRKQDKTEPFYVDEYDNRNKKETVLPGNMPSILNVWTAVAVKGSHTQIINNQIQGAGTAVILMGAQNCTVSGNQLYCGDLANCIGFFSTSYNPNDHWSRPVKNIIIEHNTFAPATNLNRGVMWIMQEHTNYYMAHNVIQPFFWHADAEGFCFHTWEDHWLGRACGGQREVQIDPVSFAACHEIGGGKQQFQPDGKMVPGVFRGWILTVTGGTGVGQWRMIQDNTADTLLLAEPLDCQLDRTSAVNISTCDKFRNTLVVDNEVNELGRGIYHWGSARDSIVDGNILRRNSGVLMEDLSRHYSGKTNWQYAGHMFNQIINNRLAAPRGFCTNYGVIGVSGGTVENSTTSMIIRGNVTEDDAILTACPLQAASQGLNYTGVVIENNLAKNCETGILVHENVSAVLKGNAFDHVKDKIRGAGENTVIIE